MAISKDKKKALNSVMAGIKKTFGEDSVDYVIDIYDKLKIKFVKTRSYEFDNMLYGGIAKGRVIEFAGENSSGKTSKALEIVAKNQAEDPNYVAGLFETEGSFDPDFARMLGVDMERFIYWDQKDTGAEKGLDILRSLVASGEFNLIIVNSVAGLTPKKEIEDELDKQNIALTARIMSKLMRVITGIAYKNNCTLIFINQLRTNVGQMFGDPNVTTGGRALAFYASQRINFRRSNKPDAGDPITIDTGMKVNCRVTKNRMAKGNPYLQCAYFVEYGKGINSFFELPTVLEREGIVAKKGSWYRWLDDTGVEQKVNSYKGFVNELEAKPELVEFFEKKLAEVQDSGTCKSNSLTEAEIQAIQEEEARLNEEFATEEDETANGEA